MICIPKTDSRPLSAPAGGHDVQGFALVSVLLFLLVVAAVITPFVLAARTDFLLASGEYRSGRQTQLADGIARLIARQVAALAVEESETLLLDSTPMRAACGDQAVEVKVQDQMSLVDLNAAQLELLTAGFSAAGVPGENASELAALAQTFRTPDGSGDAGDAAKLSNGFKFAAFEAIEELYEFPGFANLNIAQVTETFTVYGRRETISAKNMPKRLAAILPKAPTSQFPFVVADDELSHFYRIEVSVGASGDSRTGYSGMLIETNGDETATFKVLERAAKPNIVGAAQTEFSQSITCEQLFGAEVAQWLSRR